MAITYQSAGAVATTAAGATTISPAYPTGIIAGDIVVLFVAQKPSVANGGTVTTPAGWTLLTSLLAAGGYGATLGAGTGNTNLRCYYRVATGILTGTQAVTLATNNVAWAVIQRLTNATGIWNIAASTGSKTTTTTPMAIAAGFVAGAAGDYALSAFSAADNLATYNGEFYTQTGLTYGVAVEVAEPKVTVGNRLGGVVVRASVTAGLSTAGTIALGANIAGTVTNSRGPAIYVRLREVPSVSLTVPSGVVSGVGTINSVITAFPATVGSGVVQGTGTINSVTVQSNINLSIGSGVVQATGGILLGYWLADSTLITADNTLVTADNTCYLGNATISLSIGSGVVQATGAIGAGYSVNFDYALGSGVTFGTGTVNGVFTQITLTVGSGVVQGTGNIGSGYSVNYDYYYVLNSGVFATGVINPVTSGSSLNTTVASGVVSATGVINSPTFQFSYTYTLTSDYLTTEAGDRLTTESGLYLVTVDGGGVAGYGTINSVTAVAPPISLTVPSGVVTSTIQINPVVAVGSGLVVSVTGVSATGTINKVIIWGNIRSVQTPTWGAITDTQVPEWGSVTESHTYLVTESLNRLLTEISETLVTEDSGIVVTPQPVVWAPVNDSDTVGWSSISSGQDPGWT